MAAIKDVAKAAGVSVSAVSKYLKTPQNMREDTKQKIAQAIKDLDYSPNIFAQSLRTGKTGIVALMLPEIDNPYFSSIFNHIQMECSSRGMLPILLKNSSADDYAKAINLLKSGILDGAICYDDGPFRQSLHDTNIQLPIIRWAASANDEESCAIRLDLQCGYTMLCEHLESLGVEEIAYIGPVGDTSSSEKFAALTSYCGNKLHKLKLRNDLIFSDCYGYEEGYNCCDMLLSSCGTMPQAIVCESDMIALGVLKRLARAGIAVPSDVLLSGCDNITMTTMSNPSITTVDIPIERMCRAALDMLCDVIGGGTPEPVIFHSSLVIRTSTVAKR